MGRRQRGHLVAGGQVMKLAITDSLGLVHRVWDNGSSCATVNHAARREEVTRLQCKVYALPSCGLCFPSIDEYKRLVDSRRPS